MPFKATSTLRRSLETCAMGLALITVTTASASIIMGLALGSIFRVAHVVTS